MIPSDNLEGEMLSYLFDIQLVTYVMDALMSGLFQGTWVSDEMVAKFSCPLSSIISALKKKKERKGGGGAKGV